MLVGSFSFNLSITLSGPQMVVLAQIIRKARKKDNYRAFV